MERIEPRTLLSTFTVTTTDDDGAGSLRQAILDANDHPGLDAIAFAIDSGPQTIRPASALPTITDPVSLDASTQPGYSGSPLIQLSGDLAGQGVDGLRVAAGGSTIRGLAIGNFQGDALRLEEKGGNRVEGNFLGTDIAGLATLGNGGSGIVVSGSSGNTIGGASPGDGNVIAANQGYGIDIGEAAVSPTVTNTYDATDVPIVIPDVGIITSGIAVDAIPDADFVAHVSVTLDIQHTSDSDLIITLISPDGTRVILSDSNGDDEDFDGTTFDDLAAQRIGLGASPFEGTYRPDGELGTMNGKRAEGTWVLEVNDDVELDHGKLLDWSLALTTGPLVATADSGRNVVEGNRVGTNAGGTSALGNTLGGILINNSPGNSIGGAVPGIPNLISGNKGDGVLILGSNSTANVLQGNLIGTDATGAEKLRNLGNGVLVSDGASNNRIGGTSPGARNVISGNEGVGVNLSGVAVKGNVIAGNYIGGDMTGTKPLGNGGDGIDVIDASDNLIGGTALGAGNVIGDNSDGVYIKGTNATGNAIQGNFIGTDATGRKALGTSFRGVALDGAPGNLVGGLTASARNVISGNGSTGISILDAGATGNVVAGNYVGVDASGRQNLGNSSSGVSIEDAPNNLVGGLLAGSLNVISGNKGKGVLISGTGSLANRVQGNDIGTDASGSLALGNSLEGVTIDSGKGNLIGGDAAGAGNLISGNQDDGVYIKGADAAGNTIAGNRIGTDRAGQAAIGNAGVGVRLEGGSRNTVGGTSTASRNLISANGSDGIFIVLATAKGNVVQGNFIGADITGLKALGNTLSAIEVNGSSFNTIGGLTADAGNLLSGNLSAGVYIHGAAATGNLIAGNRIGTDLTGSRALGNGTQGIQVIDAQGTRIGGTAPEAGNLISGNKGDGVEVYSGASGSLVQGNLIGTDSSGLNALANGGRGLYVGSTANSIGGEVSGARNIVSANGSDGIVVVGTNLRVEGNIVGLDLSGTRPLGNAGDGISLNSGTGNVIGGTLAGAGNVVSANGLNGVYIANPGTTGNDLQGNTIGTDATGRIALGNAGKGVFIRDAPGNRIGAAETPSARNLISGNHSDGVLIFGPTSMGNIVQNNAVGTDVSGTYAIPNGGVGVFVFDAPNTTIGGTAPLSGNLISGNSDQGIEVFGRQATGELIAGNLIGTDGAGGAAIGNTRDGVLLNNTANNTIGGTTPSARNVISGNTLAGVEVLGAAATGNVVSGNYVGTTASGRGAIGNGDGIVIDGASDDVIGGTAAGAGNVVSGNLGSGIKVIGAGPTAIAVQGNRIGSDATGRSAVGNAVGVFLQGARGITIGGTTAAARNLISGNAQAGVYLFGSETTDNAVVGNDVGPDVDGLRPLASAAGAARQAIGVLIDDAPGNRIGGLTPESANVLGGNLVGVSIVGFNASGNSIQGNSIGVDRAGSVGVPNAVGVFIKDAPSNLIGGALAGAGNVISANEAAGVHILGGQARDNAIQGNRIGTDGAGRSSLPNQNGIYLEDAPANLIGGPTAAARNLISGNTEVGVYLFGAGASGNRIQGNWIGVRGDGKSSLGNGRYGILLYNASKNTVDMSRRTGNVIRASGIGPIREFTGGVPGGPAKPHPSRRPARHPSGVGKRPHHAAGAKGQAGRS